jgi:hypothetical protein
MHNVTFLTVISTLSQGGINIESFLQSSSHMHIRARCPLSFETGGTMGYNCCFFLNFVPLHIESPYNFRGTWPILGVKNPLQRVNGHAAEWHLFNNMIYGLYLDQELLFDNSSCKTNSWIPSLDIKHQSINQTNSWIPSLDINQSINQSNSWIPSLDIKQQSIKQIAEYPHLISNNNQSIKQIAEYPYLISNNNQSINQIAEYPYLISNTNQSINQIAEYPHLISINQSIK